MIACVRPGARARYFFASHPDEKEKTLSSFFLNVCVSAVNILNGNNSRRVSIHMNCVCVKKKGHTAHFFFPNIFLLSDHSILKKKKSLASLYICYLCDFFSFLCLKTQCTHERRKPNNNKNHMDVFFFFFFYEIVIFFWMNEMEFLLHTFFFF